MWSRVHGFYVCSAVYFNISSPLHTSFSHAYRSGMHLNVPCPTERVCVCVSHLLQESDESWKEKCFSAAWRARFHGGFCLNVCTFVPFSMNASCVGISGGQFPLLHQTQTLPVASSSRPRMHFSSDTKFAFVSLFVMAFCDFDLSPPWTLASNCMEKASVWKW